MKVIGVTGGIGAGKSEILNFIADNWNATVVEADEVGYLVMRPGKTCLFEDKELLKKLNQIVHPAVKDYIKNAIQREKENETDIFVVEAALLIEDKYDEICDELWYIYADEETRTERLMQNRGYSREKIQGIFANQLTEDEFSEHCDFEIDNSGDFEDTKEQIMQRMQRYEIM